MGAIIVVSPVKPEDVSLFGSGSSGLGFGMGCYQRKRLNGNHVLKALLL